MEALPRQLLAGRLDWIIGFPWEVEWAWRNEAQDSNETKRPYRSIPITGEESFIANHFACVKTPAGEALIGRIDAIIAATPDRPWRRFLADWLDPESRTAATQAETAQAGH
jgi:hypothetical protein